MEEHTFESNFYWAKQERVEFPKVNSQEPLAVKLVKPVKDIVEMEKNRSFHLHGLNEVIGKCLRNELESSLDRGYLSLEEIEPTLNMAALYLHKVEQSEDFHTTKVVDRCKKIVELGEEYDIKKEILFQILKASDTR